LVLGVMIKEPISKIEIASKEKSPRSGGGII
jgi:hypothetical protein